jgi:hypothetical protein
MQFALFVACIVISPRVLPVGIGRHLGLTNIMDMGTLPNVPLGERHGQVFGRESRRGLGLSVRPAARGLFVHASDGACNNDLRRLLYVSLLVAAVQQGQEGHGGVPHGGRVDGKRVHVGVKGDVEILLRPVLQGRLGLERLDLGPSDARVAHEQVEVAGVLLDGLGGGPELVLGRHVALQGDHVGADGARGLVEDVLPAAGDVHLGGAVVGQRFGEH